MTTASDQPPSARRLQVVHVNHASLPEGQAISREPARPPAFRDASFHDRFDFRTLVYDAILDANQRHVRIVCPALLNLGGFMAEAKILARESGRACPFTLRSLDRQTQLLVPVPPDTRTLDVDWPLGPVSLRCSPQNNELFAGERVIFTLSKNNRLEWIQDWIRFYRDVHGATAVLVFDNASTDYGTAALLDAIGELDGLRTAVVVDWPFKHGPTGHGERKFWDSNFSQLGAFEVARWRFLQRARSVVNCDVDELVVSKDGGSVFDHVERQRFGVTAFFGDWVFGIEGVTRRPGEGSPILFRDFDYVLKPRRSFKHGVVPYFPMRCRPKWAAVPSRCPPEAQWQVHAIAGWWPSRVVGSRFRFRHFREISSSWKYDRLGREPLDLARHGKDPLLRSAFARVDWTR